MSELVIYPEEEKGIALGDDRHWCSLRALEEAGLDVYDLHGFYSSDSPGERQTRAYEVSDNAWYDAPGSPDQQRWQFLTRVAGLLERLRQGKEGDM